MENALVVIVRSLSKEAELAVVIVSVPLFDTRNWLAPISIPSNQVDRVVGSSSSSDSDTEQEVQVAEETPQSSTSRYGRKRMRVMNESFVSWQNIEM